MELVGDLGLVDGGEGVSPEEGRGTFEGGVSPEEGGSPQGKGVLSEIEGRHLGLDMSIQSTGYVIVTDGEVEEAGNICDGVWWENNKNNPHREAEFRSRMVYALYKRVSGEFDSVSVEDVWFGENPKTVRGLLAINTCIDDLILNGGVSCERFVRVLPDEWRKVLMEKAGVGGTLYKGKKEYMWGVMERNLGVNPRCLLREEERRERDAWKVRGMGDRMDALGVLLGTYLSGGREGGVGSERVRVRMSEVEAVMCDDLYVLDSEVYSKVGDIVQVGCDVSRFSENVVTGLIERDPEVVWYTETSVNVGYVGRVLGLPPKKGYVAFWRKGLKG